jgi:hypothetical protein
MALNVDGHKWHDKDWVGLFVTTWHAESSQKCGMFFKEIDDFA